MGFMQLAKERYTVRKYADKPLEKEQLDKLLECLLIAPTAKNLQPVRVYDRKCGQNPSVLPTSHFRP